MTTDTGSTRPNGCLFCRNQHGLFTKVEHVIPKSLGNDVDSGLVAVEIVVPRGVVCDKCNGKRLSRMDRALIEWPPVAIFRALAQIPNRKGELVDPPQTTHWTRPTLDPDDPRNFEMTASGSTGPGSRRDNVARALCKIGVEAQWLKDPEDAEQSRWDEVRAAAIGGPLPAKLTMSLTQPTDPAEMDRRPVLGLAVTDSDESLKLVCGVSVVGLDLHLCLGGAMRSSQTAVWRVDAETGELAGPDEFCTTMSGRAQEAERQTVERSPIQPSGRHASRLPTHDETTTVELQPSERRRRRD